MWDMARKAGRNRFAAAATLAAALAVSGCAGAGQPRLAEAKVRAGLDAEMAAMATALGGGVLPSEAAARQPCHGYAENGGGYFLSRFARLPGGPGMLDRVHGQLLPRYRALGWSVTERTMGEEATAVAMRGLYGLRLILRPDGRGDVVLSGSTKCFEPT